MYSLTQLKLNRLLFLLWDGLVFYLVESIYIPIWCITLKYFHHLVSYGILMYSHQNLRYFIRWPIFLCEIYDIYVLLISNIINSSFHIYAWSCLKSLLKQDLLQRIYVQSGRSWTPWRILSRMNDNFLSKLHNKVYKTTNKSECKFIIFALFT